MSEMAVGVRPDGTDPETGWLSPQQQGQWRALAGLVVRLPAALDAQLQRDAGITHFDYVVMSALSESPQRTLRMSVLAVRVSGSLSRLSHVVSRLERQGWVRRRPCPGPGRFVNATLTDAGWDKVVACAPGHVATVRSLVVDALSPEQLRTLGDVGVAVLARIDPPGDGVPA